MKPFYIGILITFTTLFVYRTSKYLKIYRKSMFGMIYPNFFEYYFRAVIRKNLSKSLFLESIIGDHLITYNSFLDYKKNPKAQFTTIYSKKKCISMLIANSDKYGINKKADLSCFNQYMKNQKKYLQNVNIPVEYIIVTADKKAFKGNSYYRVLDMAEFIDYISTYKKSPNEIDVPFSLIKEGLINQ